MMDQSTKESTRTLKRRALRWQKHKMPRKSSVQTLERLMAWLLILLMFSAALVMLCQTAQARVGVHYAVGEYPETVYQWANVNGYQVNFRAAPSLDADIVATYSWGTCVEVVSIWDGWAEVLHHNHLQSGALYVWAEYLDIVE